jgi:hypothetical protein
VISLRHFTWLMDQRSRCLEEEAIEERLQRTCFVLATFEIDQQEELAGAQWW